VDSVRSFDPLTQRSLENLQTVEIYPAEQMVQEENLFRHAAEKLGRAYDSHARRLSGPQRERLLQRKNQLQEFIINTANIQLLENYIHYFYDDTEYLWDYMKPGGVVMLEDPDRIREVLDFREKEDKESFKAILERGEAVPGDIKAFPGRADLDSLYKLPVIFFFTPFQKQLKGVDRLDAGLHIASKQAPVFNGRMDFLETELKGWLKQNYEITIVCATEERIENLKNFVEHLKVPAESSWRKAAFPPAWSFRRKSLSTCGTAISLRLRSTGRQRRRKSAGNPSRPLPISEREITSSTKTTGSENLSELSS
jgi:transcription-repair coupling factor (superfamily II helicase)